MEVVVNVPTEGKRTVSVDGETYGDVLQAVDLRPAEASILVDGTPVPADREIESREVTVLRLISGG